METRRLTELSELEQIYNSRMKRDFARNELRPLSSLRKNWRKGEYDAYGLFAGAEFLGYACFVRIPEGERYNYLFDYFAIAEEHRDEGLGSVFLEQLAACLRDAACVIGEVEDPDAASGEADRRLRERRVRFYLRNGCLDTGVRSLLFGVDYRILEVPTGSVHTAEEIKAVYTALYRHILPPAFFKTCFKIKGDDL